MNKAAEFLPNIYQYDFTAQGVFTRADSVLTAADANQFPQITYYLNDDEINGIFGSEVNALRLDWVDIAMAVYLADRMTKRNEKTPHKNVWKRRFIIKIAVRNPEFWQKADIYSQLSAVLNYFTDDDWQFDFVNFDDKANSKIVQGKLPMPLAAQPRVALFSGGLDSFVGAANQLFEDTETPFIFVSGATNTIQISRQRKQIKELIKISPDREIIHHIVGFGIHWSNSKHPKEENSQRTRGFLFTTLGAVTALNAGVNCLEIYENGIGAFNLPYDASQLGTMNSRAVNPSALLRMENFIGKITGQKFRIENPYLFKTKGEMCRSEIVGKLAQTINETFSCDGFPVRTAGKPQDGICTSCLLRRVSLESAGLREFDNSNSYLTDLVSAQSQPSFNQLNDLRAMEWQYQIISRCLNKKTPWQALSKEYPMLQTTVSELATQKGLTEEELRTKILLLYNKYCAEWKAFSARRNFIRVNEKVA